MMTNGSSAARKRGVPVVTGAMLSQSDDAARPTARVASRRATLPASPSSASAPKIQNATTP